VNAPEVDAASRRFPDEGRGPAKRSRVHLGAAVIVLGALAAYSGSFGGPFLFDDIGSIPENPTIRHLWPIWAALSPPAGGFTVSGRPVLNLSLAINYAISGTNVWSYHALNLLIHILAGLTLFGIVRRTLEKKRRMGFQPMLNNEHGLPAHAAFLAFTVALIWTVHPLQTESVTLVIQRAESLMGLFYLLTLYCFIRYAETDAALPRTDEERGREIASTFKAFRPSYWGCFSVASCLLGMATKEVMVSAPVVVFLYDRTFVSGTFREAWRRHQGLHAGLAVSWLLLAWLVCTSGGRDGTAGFGAGVAWWAYALTQFRAIAHYLRLAVWPHPLVADYGRLLGGPPLQVIGDAVVVIGLLGGTIWALRRGKRAIGFAGAAFFLILAPTSSFVPIATEIIAEHRMYLPLAAVVAVVVVGGCALAGLPGSGDDPRGKPGPRIGQFWMAACLIVAVGFGFMTFRRNLVYQSDLAFWTDAALKIPGNAGAHNNLGNVLAESGQFEPAMAQYREALRLVPEYADAHTDLGNALVKEGRPAEAVDHYRAALRFRPGDPAVHYGLGLALMRLGRGDEAIPQFERVVSLSPDHAAAWSNLAELLVAAGRWAEAADAYAATTRLRPDNADARINYGNVLVELGRRPEAVAEYRAALRLQPAAADVHNNLGIMLAESGQFAAAKVEFEDALRLKPDYPEARDNLQRVEMLEKGESGQ